MPEVSESHGVFTLANGDSAGWMDMRGLVAAEFNAAITGTVTLLLEAANDITKDTKSDALTIATYSSSVAKSIFAPFPNFLRFRQSAGSGTVILGWGRGLTPKNDLVPISKQGFKGAISNDLTPS